MDIVFDLDGTVWDSEPGIVSCIRETLEHFGVESPPDDELRHLLGPPLMAMLAELGVPVERLDEGRVLYRRRYREHGELECTPYDGIGDLLEHLRRQGHRLATATSKGAEVAERMLAHFELAPRFDVVEGAPMTSASHSKADIVAAAMAGLRSLDGAVDCPGAMVGDRRYDIEGGRANGLVTIGVTWGYGTADELERAGADHVVHDVAGLRALLDAMADDDGRGFDPIAARG